MPKTEEITYLVPEINVTVSQAWVTLISYCQENLPYGDLYHEINNGQPGRRLREIPNIRFDKQPVPAKEGQAYIIQSLGLRIQQSWINLIQWCQNYFISGRIGYRLIGGQPTELLAVKPRVDFSRPETIPNSMILEFSKQ